MEWAAVKPGPVEKMMAQHMSHYFNYRFQGLRKPYAHPTAQTYHARDFMRASPSSYVYLRDTQQHFVAILAALARLIDYRITHNERINSYLEHPFQGVRPQLSTLPLNLTYPTLLTDRAIAISNLFDSAELCKLAHNIASKVEQ
jgi:hypothetical protein